MEFGAHLPLMDFGGNPYTLEQLTGYADTAARLGYAALAANDHLVFGVPWMDGPTALAAVIGSSGGLDLVTTVVLPVIRGPVAVAKTLAAIDRLSGGRLIAGVGPGSSRLDYAAVGLDHGERWRRFDESIGVLRSLWQADAPPFSGDFYSTEGMHLDPHPSRPGGPPIWLGSWGSDRGLHRTADLADGWLASAYNTTPADFGRALSRLHELLPGYGKDAASFPNALSTMWFYLTEDRDEADRILRERVAPIVRRPEEVLRQRLGIGSATEFAEKLRAYQQAGLQRVFLWPVAREIEQLERFHDTVRPLLAAPSSG